MAKNVTFEEFSNFQASVDSRFAQQDAKLDAILEKLSHKGESKVVKDTEFVRKDGSKVMTSKAQAAAWTAARERHDEAIAGYAEKRAAYTPSQELKDALKKDATMTHKQAKTYGFVGTREDLKALKKSLGLR